MSHDFAFWKTEAPLEDDEATRIYRSLMKSGQSSGTTPSDEIARLAGDILKRWPIPKPGKEDSWPLAAEVEVSDFHLVICIVPSRLWDVWPVVGELAEKYELVMYDPQQKCVFLPPGLSRKRTRARAKIKRKSTK